MSDPAEKVVYACEGWNPSSTIVGEWTNADVLGWLLFEVDLKSAVPAFIKNEVNGEMLLGLDHNGGKNDTANLLGKETGCNVQAIVTSIIQLRNKTGGWNAKQDKAMWKMLRMYELQLYVLQFQRTKKVQLKGHFELSALLLSAPLSILGTFSAAAPAGNEEPSSDVLIDENTSRWAMAALSLLLTLITSICKVSTVA
jgi:hypothetical protein